MYHIGCIMVKDLSCGTIDSINSLCLTINKINECIEEINGNKHLTLVSRDESKDRLKQYEVCIQNVLDDICCKLIS